MYAKSNSFLFQHSLQDSLHHQQDFQDALLRKLKLDLRTEWTPTKDVIDSLWMIQEQVGPSTLLKIGTSIARKAVFPVPKDATFETFLENDLNEIYRLNHIKLSEGFRITKLDNGYSVSTKENPYPDLFNIGLLKGFAARHHSLYQFKTIEQGHLLLESVI